jgi:hypothetical protein
MPAIFVIMYWKRMIRSSQYCNILWSKKFVMYCWLAALPSACCSIQFGISVRMQLHFHNFPKLLRLEYRYEVHFYRQKVLHMHRSFLSSFYTPNYIIMLKTATTSLWNFNDYETNVVRRWKYFTHKNETNIFTLLSLRQQISPHYSFVFLRMCKGIRQLW